MDKFDEKVIGYESTKDILRQILDILKRPEVYKRKGISIPRGLLMESDPGLGKSLLASILIEESERKPFVFRKTSQENSFLDELRAVFAMAKEDAPSILLLEDLNLYVESTSPYAPEWACLQACIDDAKDTDLFVIATTNDTRYMPPSLLRPGRFDYVIYLQPPIGENAENIVSYYLRDKDLAEDVLISDIVKAMPKVSCATLETVMNLAALNSVYQGHEHIEDVLDYYRNGLLCRWLKVRGYEEELKKVEEIRSEDSMGIIKELIQIFEIPCDPAEVEKSIYILKYKVESESENEQYKQEGYKVEGIIEDYQQGYRSLLNTIFENQNDAAQIKAAIQEIVEKYKWVLQYDYRRVLTELTDQKMLLAVMCFLMNGVFPKFCVKSRQL